MAESINTPSDIEVSDMFKINPYEYFIVKDTEGEINGIVRDGIYTVGQEYEETYDASSIIKRVHNDEWDYIGKFSYKGKDINGEPV